MILLVQAAYNVIVLVYVPVLLDTLARLVPPLADVVLLMELLLVPVAIHRGNVAVILATLA